MPTNQKIEVLGALCESHFDTVKRMWCVRGKATHVMLTTEWKVCWYDTEQAAWAAAFEMPGPAYLHLLMTEGVKWAYVQRGFDFTLSFETADYTAKFRSCGGDGKVFTGWGADPATAIESALWQIVKEEK